MAADLCFHPVLPRPRRLRLWMVLGGTLLAILACAPHRASGQAPLRYANEATTVQAISFRFADRPTFETSRLRKQIATSAPGFLDRLRNTFAFLPGVQPRTFSFDPVTLQKDVVRLRRFYKQNGFLNPQVDYPASQLDTTQNQIHVIFTIQEGPFLTVRNLDVLNATGTADVGTVLSEQVQASWRTFRRENVRIQGRYTDLERSRLENDIQSWFRNRGFAFANVQSSAEVDTSQSTVDVRFRVDPGPRTVVSEIQIDGNTSVSESVVRRELPFTVGSRFSASEVERGRQRLSTLDIFRVALSELPAQPRDSTVVVRYRVREAAPRSLSGQIGYGTQSGFTLEGSWKHRNFYGNVRTLTVELTADTGYPEAPPAFIPDFMVRPPSQRLRRRFRAEVTLQQPYLFADPLSGSIAPFIQERVNPDRALAPSRFLDLNERKYGVNTTLTYDFLPYRPLTLQHSFFQTRRFSASRAPDSGQSDPAPLTGADLFNGSIFSLDGTFGNADDFISPTRGYILNPNVQVGGLLFESGVEFVRASTEVSGYLPLSEYVRLAGRLSAGALWPLQESRDILTPPSSPANQQDYRDRFSDYLFYAGGPSDVRGWASRLAGGKILQESPVFQDRYRAIGGRFKVGASLEARFPLPALGSNWRTAAFVDGAYLTPGALALTPTTRAVEGPDGRPISTEPTQLLVGSGVGLRYKTSFGFLRVDVAFKLTPDRLDLRSPSSVRTAVRKGKPLPPPKLIRRFRLHFGIGRSF